ncbi:RICIN domain-containing protein [Streptomyces sp. MA15]|uniref:RICIN domain-containing protein n=1 Tax=Streptomyces sp. MA15 TaxID=3055061 RepID=UPI0025B260E9|nr:RICIN domain-containing protein [Streptomyces sp. MA15]
MKVPMKRMLATLAGAASLASLIVAMPTTAHAAPSVFKFYNANSGRCLGLDFDDPSLNTVNTGYECFLKTTHWIVDYGVKGGGLTMLRNRGTGECLDRSSTGGREVYMSPCSSGDPGQWWGSTGPFHMTSDWGRYLTGWADETVSIAPRDAVGDMSKATWTAEPQPV